MPRLAMSGSLVLGLVSAGLLIYSIHHLASSIQIDAIMGQVEREAHWVIDDLYPNGSGYLEPEQRCPDPPASAAVRPAAPATSRPSSPSPHPAAARQDLVVRLARQVGDHVVAGTPLAFAWRRDLDQPAADAQALQAALAAAVASGFEPTMVQDVPFGLRRLVDIGNKVLSPAVNDPPPASKRSSTCRSCCACWPAGGLATGSITTSRGRCASPSPSRFAPDKAQPNDPAERCSIYFPMVCREAWSAASGCNARRPSMLAGAYRAYGLSPTVGMPRRRTWR